MGISCPKCKGKPDRITEQAFVTLNYSFKNGQFVQAPTNKMTGLRRGYSDAQIEWDMGEPDPTGVVLASCGECGHDWRLRRFKNIDEAIEAFGVKFED